MSNNRNWGGKRAGAGAKPAIRKRFKELEKLLDKQRRSWKEGIDLLADGFPTLMKRMLVWAEQDKKVAMFLVGQYIQANVAAAPAEESPITQLAKEVRRLIKDAGDGRPALAGDAGAHTVTVGGQIDTGAEHAILVARTHQAGDGRGEEREELHGRFVLGEPSSTR